MSRKVGIEIDLDLDTKAYDIRFRKLSKDEDFEINYWELRELLDKVWLQMDDKVSGQGAENSFSKFSLN